MQCAGGNWGGSKRNIRIVLEIAGPAINRSGLIHRWAHLISDPLTVALLVVDARHVAKDRPAFTCFPALFAEVLFDHAELPVLVRFVIHKDGDCGIGALFAFIEGVFVKLGDVDFECEDLRHIILVGFWGEFMDDCRPDFLIQNDKFLSGFLQLGGEVVALGDDVEWLHVRMET